MEKLERMAVGDRPRWLVEIDRFYRTQLGGADPIQQWLTIPLMYFESPQACVRRFWTRLQPADRRVARAADHRGHPLRADPCVRDLGARLRPGRAGEHRGGRGAREAWRSHRDGQLPQPGHRGEHPAGGRDPEVGRMSAKARAAIIGPGNIGTDLLAKLQRSDAIEVQYVVGVVESDGLQRARSMGIEASAEGVDWLLSRDELPQIVFDATSAKAHRAAAPRLEEAGIVAVDLTPAAVGPLVSPPVNFREHVDAMNINMISCGAQATVPIVHAVSSVVTVAYAEIVASVASKSAGPGTRANIDEFTHTTSRAVRELGGTPRGKAIIVLNPVEPPMIMRDTIFCAIPADADHEAITASVKARVAEVQEYVPGYTLRAEPQYDDPREKWDGNGRVTVFIEVLGAGDYLPTYAGNLDIMTAAAARVGELVATTRFVGAGA